MALPKSKTTMVLVAAILAAATGVLLFHYATSNGVESRRQRLDGGSLLVLNRLSVGSHISFTHGTAIEKFLGRAIPSKGVHLLKFNLQRPTRLNYDEFPRSWMVAEFKLTGTNAANHPLVKPKFFRQFRFVVYGEQGIEFVQELSPSQFTKYPDGYFGYVVTSRFPRDSHWLGFRVEQRQNGNAGWPWQKLADLKAPNPVHPTIQPWVTEPVPSTRSAAGLDFVLEGITVKTIPYMPRDIWNHVVTAPMVVRSNGVVLTNWSATFVHAEDASGNWDLLASHRSLDPRFVWKLDADFEPESNFPEGSCITVSLPGRSSNLSTNVLNMPVTLSWDGYWLDASMPTNQPNLALKYVCVTNDQGERDVSQSGSWGQFSFRKGSFTTRRGDVLTMDFKPTKATFAVVPNVHVTFYCQPRLVTE